MVGGRGRERSRTTRRYNSFDETRTCGEVLFKCQRGVQANEKSAKKKRRKGTDGVGLAFKAKQVLILSRPERMPHTRVTCARGAGSESREGREGFTHCASHSVRHLHAENGEAAAEGAVWARVAPRDRPRYLARNSHEHREANLQQRR